MVIRVNERLDQVWLSLLGFSTVRVSMLVLSETIRGPPTFSDGRWCRLRHEGGDVQCPSRLDFGTLDVDGTSDVRCPE